MAATVAPGVRSVSEMGARTRTIVMAGALLGLFTAAMDQTVVGTSMPRIIGSLGGFGLFSWVGTSFMLASTTTIPIVGKLTDMYGRKPFYMAGVAILILGSALAGSSQSIEQLIAFRVVQGLGAGMIMGIAFAIVGDVFPPAERGKWAGLMSGVFASASVIGPLIGGTLTDHAHWRWVFYVNLPLGALTLLVLFFGMPTIRPAIRPKLDYRGIVLLVATVVPMLLAFSWAGSRYDWVSPEVIALLSWTVVALTVFTYAEMRAEEPLLPMSLFKNRIFIVSALVTLITGFAMFGSLFYIPLFVQGIIGSSATNSGLVTMPMMIAMAISSAISGQIMSRLGHYRILGVTGLSILVAGAYLLSRLDVNSTNFEATRAMVVLGAGLGASIPLFMLAVQNAVPYRFMGISTSTLQFLRAVGGTMGVAVLFSLVQGHYASNLKGTIPAPIQERPEFVQALKDPQFLLNAEAFGKLKEATLAFGDQGPILFQQTVEGVKIALASAIADAFFIAIFIALAAVVVGAFMKEVPLRKSHFDPAEEPASAPPAPPALPAVAGGANGAPPLPQIARWRNGPSWAVWAIALLAVATVLGLARAVRRNGRQPRAL